MGERPAARGLHERVLATALENLAVVRKESGAGKEVKKHLARAAAIRQRRKEQGLD